MISRMYLHVLLQQIHQPALNPSTISSPSNHVSKYFHRQCDQTQELSISSSRNPLQRVTQRLPHTPPFVFVDPVKLFAIVIEPKFLQLLHILRFVFRRRVQLTERLIRHVVILGRRVIRSNHTLSLDTYRPGPPQRIIPAIHVTHKSWLSLGPHVVLRRHHCPPLQG